MSYKSVPEECPTKQCPTRVNAPQELSSALQECPTRVSPTGVPYKSVKQCLAKFRRVCVSFRISWVPSWLAWELQSLRVPAKVTWSHEDVYLLNAITSSFSAIVMLEVCEVMAPAIFILLLLCLRSNTFLGQNSEYFVGLADANVEDSLIRNGYSFLVEAFVLLMTDVCMRAVVGVSFLSFIHLVLRCDFSFWLSTLSMAYVAWLTMMVDHTGHDLKFQFLWLP